MSHARKVLFVALALTFTGAAVFAQSTAEPKQAWPAYVFSIFVGFGTGHYWAGQNGNLFLAGDLSCVGVAALGAAFVAFSPSPSPDAGFTSTSAGYLMIGIAAIAFSAFRIWELADVFRAVEEARKAGAVARVEPVIRMDPVSLEVGVRLSL